MKKIKTLILTALLLPSYLLGVTFEPNVLWEKANLDYCFYKSHSDIFATELINRNNAKKKFRLIPGILKDKEKAFISKQIENSFSKETTGINFSKVSSCSHADLVILKNVKMRLGGGKKHYGQASIGEAGRISSRGASFFKKKKGFFDKKGSKAYVSLATVDKTTLIHELGHIAGLRHEHAREEALSDDGCAGETAPSQGRSSLFEGLYITTDISNYYDPNSFMNYCYVNWNRKEINAGKLPILSNQDKKELKKIYSF